MISGLEVFRDRDNVDRTADTAYDNSGCGRSRVVFGN